MILDLNSANVAALKQRSRNMALKGIASPRGDIERIDSNIERIDNEITELKKDVAEIKTQLRKILIILKEKGIKP